MRSSSRPARTIPALLLSLGIALATAPTATAAAPANTCGGALSDYTGLASLDTAFVGTVALPGGGTYPMKITPTVFSSNDLITVQVDPSATESRTAVARLKLFVNTLGRGSIVFAAPRGPGYEGYSTDVYCPIGTRVTKINGRIPITGLDKMVTFEVERT
ncbi:MULTISPECIES: hypothetical protein [unclassified Streptomyces]|uniref:Uncharacterized protein n=1 Tax=Streptomyces sp. NBC_00060 TaxID=2975636 RepID=A0AAU2GT30_9ACTN